MIKQFVALFALAALAEAGSLGWVSVSLIGDMAMVRNWGDSNFGLSDPALAKTNWKTVSVNGNEATIYSPTCEKLVLPVSNFTELERDLLDQTKRVADPLNLPQTVATLHAASGVLRLGKGNSYLPSDTNPYDIVYSYEGNVSVQKIDDDNYSVEKPGLANNVAGIWVNKGLVSFFYHDYTVQMKPIACLKGDELELFKQLKSEVPSMNKQTKQASETTETNETHHQ